LPENGRLKEQKGREVEELQNWKMRRQTGLSHAVTAACSIYVLSLAMQMFCLSLHFLATTATNASHLIGEGGGNCVVVTDVEVLCFFHVFYVLRAVVFYE